jgi:prevent-host-death family protein
MSTINIRDLSRHTSRVVEDVSSTGRPALVTRHGALVAAVVPINPEELEDFVLANHPDFLGAMAEAEEDAAEGRTRPLTDVLAELDD